MEKYILTIDQGTTSTRAILVDKEGRVVDLNLTKNYMEQEPNRLSEKFSLKKTSPSRTLTL